MSDTSTNADAQWKQRFRAPVTYANVARANPTRGIATSNRSGVFQLYAWDVATGELLSLTNRPEGKTFGHIAPDGRYIYYLDDQHGNETGHYVRVPFEGGEPEDITPTMQPYSSFGMGSSHTSNLLGVLVANAEGFQLYGIALNLDGAVGENRVLYQSKRFTLGPELSHNGEIAVVASSERSEKLQFHLIAIDTGSGEHIAELWDGPDTSIEPGNFSPLPGDMRIAAASNRSGIKRPLIWNPRTGERIDLKLDDLKGEIEPQDWSPDGNSLLLVQYTNAVQTLYLYDLTTHEVSRLRHPSGSYFGSYFVAEDEIWAQWTDSTHPTHLIALDRATGEKKRTVLPPSEVPPSHPWRSVTFTSSDGQDVQGWLGVPDGVGPFPTILETHGGPTAATPEMFTPGSQAWLDRGFAFLTLNYRGSTTFGKAFEEQIYGDLGHWEVEDMVAARQWLIDQGITRPDEIFLTGWSYGGYLTLQALGTRPELWAGGMAGIAIADWTMMYEDSADTLKGYQVALFGGTPEEKVEVYQRASPITYVEQVKAPVLIIQGRNDTRTPARPIVEYEKRMRELGKDIEVHWFEAGHGSYVVEQQIDFQELMHQFTDRVLD
jgi:dipeptidyl aminopeptidase/acylaminoacyl peptidase